MSNCKIIAQGTPSELINNEKLKMHILGNLLIQLKCPKVLNQINKKIKNFNKKIKYSGDKSLSIRWVLLASQAMGNQELITF